MISPSLSLHRVHTCIQGPSWIPFMVISFLQVSHLSSLAQQLDSVRCLQMKMRAWRVTVVPSVFCWMLPLATHCNTMLSPPPHTSGLSVLPRMHWAAKGCGASFMERFSLHPYMSFTPTPHTHTRSSTQRRVLVAKQHIYIPPLLSVRGRKSIVMSMAANVHWSGLMHPMAETLPVRKKCLHGEVLNGQLAGFCFSCVCMCKFSPFEKSTTSLPCNLSG